MHCLGSEDPRSAQENHHHRTLAFPGEMETTLCNLSRRHVHAAPVEPGQVAEHQVSVCCWNLGRKWQEDVHRVVKLVMISPYFKDFLYKPDLSDLPANLNNGGAYDIVCCAVVGLMFPGLEAR